MKYDDIPVGSITAASLQMAADAAGVSVENLIARLLDNAAEQGENSLIKAAGLPVVDNIRPELRNASDRDRFDLWALVDPAEAKIVSTAPDMNKVINLISGFVAKRGFSSSVTQVNVLSVIISVESAKCWCSYGSQETGLMLAYIEALLRKVGLEPEMLCGQQQV